MREVVVITGYGGAGLVCSLDHSRTSLAMKTMLSWTKTTNNTANTIMLNIAMYRLI